MYQALPLIFGVPGNEAITVKRDQIWNCFAHVQVPWEEYQSYRQTVEIYSLNSQLQSVHDLVVQQTILNFLVQPHTCLCQSHVEIEHHIL